MDNLAAQVTPMIQLALECEGIERGVELPLTERRCAFDQLGPSLVAIDPGDEAGTVGGERVHLL